MIISELDDGGEEQDESRVHNNLSPKRNGNRTHSNNIVAAEKLRTRDRRTNVVRRKWNFLVTKKIKKKQRDHNNYVHVYVSVSLSAPTDPLSKRHAQREKTWFNNKRRWTRIYVRHYRFSAVLRSAVRPRPNPLKHFRGTVMVSLFVITKKN